MRETLGLKFTLDETGEAGTFTGMASVFNTLIDAWIPTKIVPGAFTDTLKDTSRVKVLRDHNDPIGRPLELQERATGLWIKGEIVTQIARGADTLALMRAGVLDEMSIGFDPVEYHMVKDGQQDVRIITKLKLWEVSIVTFGANKEAKVESVHAAIAGRTVPTWLRSLVSVATMAKPAAGWPEAERAIAARALQELATLGLVPEPARSDLAARKAAIDTKLQALTALQPKVA